MSDKVNVDTGGKMPADEGKPTPVRSDKTASVQSGKTTPAQFEKPATAEHGAEARAKRRVFAPPRRAEAILLLLTAACFLALAICAIVDYSLLTAWADLLGVKYGYVAVIVFIAAAFAAGIVFNLNKVPAKARVAGLAVTFALLLLYAVFASVCYAEKFKKDSLACVAVAEWVDSFEGFTEERAEEYSVISEEYDSFVNAVRKRVDKEKWTSIKTANGVYRQIASIGEINPANEQKIYRAKSDYEALNAEQQAYVLNANELTYAVNRYEYLSKMQYSVSFNVRLADGSEPWKVTAMLGYWQEFEVPFAEYGRAYYDFIGWARDIDAKEPEYTAGETVSQLMDENLTSANFYAVWKGKPAQVHIQIGGHGAPPQVFCNGGTDQTVYYGESSGLPMPYAMSSYSNYYCYGLFTQSGEFVYSYERGLAKSVDGVTDENGNWILTEDITLYAYWATK